MVALMPHILSWQLSVCSLRFAVCTIELPISTRQLPYNPDLSWNGFSSTCTPRLVLSNSCHSSTTKTCKLLNMAECSFELSASNADFRGVVSKTTGQFLFERGFLGGEVLAGAGGNFPDGASSRSSQTSCMALRISLVSARSGVIHSICKPLFLRVL